MERPSGRSTAFQAAAIEALGEAASRNRRVAASAKQITQFDGLVRPACKQASWFVFDSPNVARSTR